MTTYDVIIIGGGITGLAAAYRLSQSAPSLKVALLEASNRLGGKIKTERIGDFVLEAGADSFLDCLDVRPIGLCRSL